MRAGRTLGIVGDSGCGKSITTRSILRIIDRTGCIVGGESPFRRRKTLDSGDADEVVDLTKLASNSQDMRAIRGAEIALVFQEPMSSFSRVHTVGEQIIEAIMLHQHVNQRQARQKAIEMLRLVGIPLRGTANLRAWPPRSIVVARMPRQRITAYGLSFTC